MNFPVEFFQAWAFPAGVCSGWRVYESSETTRVDPVFASNQLIQQADSHIVEQFAQPFHLFQIHRAGQGGGFGMVVSDDGVAGPVIQQHAYDVPQINLDSIAATPGNLVVADQFLVPIKTE